MRGDSPSVSDARLFLRPARRFVNSLVATRRAVEIVDSQRLSSTEVESEFVTEARLSAPQYTETHHREAARIIHAAVHSYMDARKGLESETDEKLDAIYRQSFGPLQDELENLTGDPGANSHYRQVWNTISSRPSTQRLLGSALLMQAVSSFEVLVAQLVRGVLAANPAILKASEKSFKLRDLDPYESVADLREAIAEEVADQTLREGFRGWMTWFEAKLKVEVPGVLSGAQELTEIFQRRHLFVHNGGVVNRAYLEALHGSSGLAEEGSQLAVTRKYLLGAIDLLEGSGLKLVAAAALKYATEDERVAVEEALDRICYEALQRGQHDVVENLGGWLQRFVEDEPSKVRIQVNCWLASKSARGVESVADEVARWDTRALSDDYKLAKLALLDELDGALALAKRMLESGHLHEVSWRSWPILERVRAHAEAIDADVPDPTSWRTGHSD